MRRSRPADTPRDRPKETPPRNDLTWRGPPGHPATTFAVAGYRSISALSEAPISLRHVPVDAGHGNGVGVHYGVVDNVIDQVRTRRADVLMQRDIAGAIVVEVADATHADIRASLGDSDGGYNCVVLYGEHLERSHPAGITMQQDIVGAVAVEVAHSIDLPVSALYRQRCVGLHHIVAHQLAPQRHRAISAIDLMMEDVAGAIPIEVADAVQIPGRTVCPEGGVCHHRVVVHYHHFKGPVAAYVPMYQDVVGAVAVEVAGAVHDPIRSAHGDLELSQY